MRNLLTLLGKELRHLLLSPIAYVAIGTFTFVTGVVFWTIFQLFAQANRALPPWEVFLGGPSILYFLFLLILTPAITMRLIAEEKRTGTLELLMTAPVSALEVVVSKYLAACAVFFLMLLPTLVHILLIWGYAAEGATFPWGPVLAYYGGLLLVGVLFLSIGMLATAVSPNQITAYILTFGVLISIFLLPILGQALDYEWVQTVLGVLDIRDHLQQFARGVVDSRAVIFPLSLALFNVFCAIQIVDSRKWK